MYEEKIEIIEPLLESLQKTKDALVLLDKTNTTSHEDPRAR